MARDGAGPSQQRTLVASTSHGSLNSSFSSSSQQQRLTVVLRKPFGVGFHVAAGGGDEPLVVDVKGVSAKAAGVKVEPPTLCHVR